MNKLVALTLAAGIGLGSGAGFIGRANAQDAAQPPAAPPAATPGDHAPGMAGERGPGMMGDRGPGMMGERGPRMMDGRAPFMGDRGRMERRAMWMRRMRQFALIYPAQDRNLSGADVQKIAEAFLLFNGNHSWKITEVTEEPNRVTFAIADAGRHGDRSFRDGPAHRPAGTSRLAHDTRGGVRPRRVNLSFMHPAHTSARAA